MKLYINGKFYAGPLNGVHRVADRLVRAIDARFESHYRPHGVEEIRLIIPTRRSWGPEVSAIRVSEHPLGHTQLWEQALLPMSSRDGLLLNFANYAPILHRSKILMLHDAQFCLPDHSYPFRKWLMLRTLSPLMAKTSRQVLTVSEYSRELLEGFGICHRSRSAVLYNGVDHILEVAPDPSIVQELGLAGRPFVLHVASTKGYKNSQIVFDAFRMPELAEIPLVVLGPGREDLARTGLEAPVGTIFTGRISDHALRALYEAALCLAFPSRTEGFGLPPMEAALCGCPSVVAPAGAIPEICRDSVLYADIGATEDWCSAILRYRAEPDLRAQKIALCRNRAEHFTWSNAGDLLAEIVTGSLRSSGVASPMEPASSEPVRSIAKN